MLCRIDSSGRSVVPVHQFADQVRGIHCMNNGTMFVSTDADPWDPTKPCWLHRSTDGGESFTPVKEFPVSCVLWWSMAHDRDDNLYVGEYGPRGVGQSKNVWKTTDYGDTWQIVFQAPDTDGVHIHRVAVDPYTNFVWVSYGDRPHGQGVNLSRDGGATWSKEREAQSTGVAFTSEAIYWGEDNARGIVTRYDRETGQLTTVLEAATRGPYGGSVYDMSVTENGQIVVPMRKYPNETFKPTVWIGSGTQWDLMMEITVPDSVNGGYSQVSPPDKDGYSYVLDHRFEEPCRDTVPPARPTPFTAAYESGKTVLLWGSNLEPDFRAYSLYRGASVDFVPGTENLVITKSDTGYVDPGPAGGYYKLTAVDFAGNASPFAAATPVETAGGPIPGTSLVLGGVFPNPAGRHGVQVEFTLPSSDPARIELVDVAGRRVLVAVVPAGSAGRHTLELAFGPRIAPGIYLVRLVQGASARTRRVAVY